MMDGKMSCFVATEDNTEIRVNGSSAVHSTIDASDPNNRYVILEGMNMTPHMRPFVTASGKKVFAYQDRVSASES